MRVTSPTRERSATSDEDSRWSAKMFPMLGALYAVCWVLVPSSWYVQDARSISSPSIDKPGILTPIFRSISSVHVRIVQQLLPVRFRSVPGFIVSPKNSLRSHLTVSNSKNFPWGACHQTTLASHSGTCTDKLDQCKFASTRPVLALH